MVRKYENITMSSWYRRCYTVAKRRYYGKKIILWICDLFVGHAESASLIKEHRMAGTNEDVTVRMKKNLLCWFWEWVMEEWQKKCKRNVSDQRGRGRPSLTFQSIKYTVGSLCKKLVEKRYVETLAFNAPFSLTTSIETTRVLV